VSYSIPKVLCFSSSYVLPLLFVYLFFFISPHITEIANGWLVSILRTVGDIV